MSTSAIVLGVDGGGSKTEVQIAEILRAEDSVVSTRILAQSVGGSSNLHSAGKRQGLKNLELAVFEALGAAGLNVDDIQHMVFALAGSEYPDIHKAISSWCDSHNVRCEYQIISDVIPVVHAGTPDGWGIALIAGTGSIAMARNQSGGVQVCGGWGHWYGDRGSAFDLGRSALEAVAEAVDGTGPNTQLLENIKQHFAVEDPKHILQEIVRLSPGEQGGEKFRIAGLASLVINTAEAGDEVAKILVNTAAMHLAKLVITLADAVFPKEPFPLALAGGVVCNSAYYRNCLLEKMDPKRYSLGPQALVTHPVLGCLNISRKVVFS